LGQVLQKRDAHIVEYYVSYVQVCRLVALVYIRNALAGESGRTETDQGFYSLMVAPSEAPRNAQTGKVQAAPNWMV